MKIIIPGGSGQVGTMLARAFHANHHEVLVLSRATASTPWRALPWDAQTQGPWTAELDHADIVINLAGRNVNCRYNEANRQAILDSRILSTKAVGEAIQKAKHPPKAWLQMSTATIYAHRFDAPNDEATGILGTQHDAVPETWRFSHKVATEWERAATSIDTPHTRKVLLRTAVVMSPDPKGPFDILLNLVRHGLGGTNADGKQYISWIHDQDLIRAVTWLMENTIEGPVNLAAPNPLPNKEFMAILRQTANATIGLPSAKWMLTIGALLMRSETELILKSRRVIPGRLLEAGFQFDFPTWPEAARDLYSRWSA